ncbi:hypothetical protein PR003_g11912 [Phytophthora rubi]|uniref:Uncharacterized protein n=1 Tax=Phytophthora rubi TaxID=129364 RepID=A0A6A4F9U5_9STRA|nr:hypothetical protein PR002_g11722 [Phytophthora rubi]KAE9029452.1 hypothetical protein PR001_g11510 [Phytophthora rubi]KAE9337637.1 hypothetical protein PR003_g11912 [Phytophthora rubi]
MLIPTALSAWNSFSTRTPFWSITPTYYEVARERLRPSNPGDAEIERAARVVEETYGHLIEDACEEDDGEGNPLSTELLADNDDDLNAVGDGEDADEYGAIDSGDDAEKDDL